MSLTAKKILQPFYFSAFEERRPYAASRRSKFLSFAFQFFGIMLIVTGSYYLYWRWRYSMNWDAAWFSIPLTLAEVFSFIGTILVIINYWDNRDVPQSLPVRLLSEIDETEPENDRPLKIDVFIATYNEDAELVRYSIRDAVQMTYPYREVTIKIWVLDDGRREAMKQVAEEEGVYYLTRENNSGYKAGNLRNGLEKSDGDLFVILDADTRTFPGFLEHTTGYFRNRKMAWVQTPQWFYDLTGPVRITTYLRWAFGRKEPAKPNWLDKTLGRIKTGRDVFGNDPQIFYDVILRRRNLYNAAFCCGAGSIHRRRAIMECACSVYEEEIKRKYSEYLNSDEGRKAQPIARVEALSVIMKNVEIRPFVYHASEDIFTSLTVHANRMRWQSYQHPEVECKMLSPQDLDGWIKQRTRYASGSLDIAVKNNPLFMKGLSLSQRLCYFQTIYSYLAPFWLAVFILSPAVFFLTLTPPIHTFNFDFFKIFIPFQILNVITMTLGTWGIPTKRADQYYVSSFPLMLRSFFAVVKGEKVKFHVTRKTGIVTGNLYYVIPHLVIIGITLTGIIYNAWLIIQETHPSYSGFVANMIWSMFNFYSLGIMVMAAFWKGNSNN